jgi:hypothetical protein
VLVDAHRAAGARIAKPAVGDADAGTRAGSHACTSRRAGSGHGARCSNAGVGHATGRRARPRTTAAEIAWTGLIDAPTGSARDITAAAGHRAIGRRRGRDAAPAKRGRAHPARIASPRRAASGRAGEIAS